MVEVQTKDIVGLKVINHVVLTVTIHPVIIYGVQTIINVPLIFEINIGSPSASLSFDSGFTFIGVLIVVVYISFVAIGSALFSISKLVQLLFWTQIVCNQGHNGHDGINFQLQLSTIAIHEYDQFPLKYNLTISQSIVPDQATRGKSYN